MKKVCFLIAALVLCGTFAANTANACDCAGKKSECNCGADCKCGCQEGGNCNCKECADK